jgi:hypothetical protein
VTPWTSGAGGEVDRAGQLKVSAFRWASASARLGDRPTDRVAIGVLTKAFPPGLVDEVVAETGWVQQRSRLLPARLVVYFVLSMALFFRAGLRGSRPAFDRGPAGPAVA